MNSLRNHIAFYSVIAMIIWLLTDFFGGMFIYLLAYSFLIFPFILLYIASFIETIISTIIKGFKTTKLRVYFHSFFLFTILCFTVYHSELFKSNRILEATLHDDLFSYTLVFRENGKVENHINGFMAFSESIDGTYEMKGDTIIFTQRPYKNDFISNELLIDRQANVLWMHRNQNGEFNREKTFLNYLEIHSDETE